MILPNKYISEHNALIGKAALILNELQNKSSVSEMWENLRDKIEFSNFEHFVLALDLLYLMGVIEIDQHIIKRVS